MLGVAVLSPAGAQRSLESRLEGAAGGASQQRTPQRPNASRRAEAPETTEEQKPPQTQPTTLTPTALDRLIDRTLYRLGPGDKLVMSLWGTTNEAFDVVVTPEGDVLIPSVGPIRVAGRTIAGAESLVVAEAAGAYRNVRVTLSLVEVRTFRVHIAGVVENPGTYVASPAVRVSSLIQLAGGLADSASRRRIVLRRLTGEPRVIDLHLFHVTGDTSENPPVEMGDVIVVPVKGDSVVVWGAVRQPGGYEYRPGDTFSRILTLAGGPTDGARLSETEWSSFPNDSAPSVMRVVDLSRIMASRQDDAIRPGDRLFIPTWPDWRVRQSVKVQGAVRYPGEYVVIEGLTRFSEVINRAGGVNEDAALTTSYVVRQSVQELPDPEFERLLLMRQSEMTREEYAYFKVRAREIRGRVAIDMEKALRDPGGPDDVLMHGDDRIVVTRRRATVEVSGQVNRPGLIAHEAGRTVDYYIEQAGGFSWNARTSRMRVIRARTGIWVKPSKSTVLEPGDTVFVPEKEQRDWWWTFKDILAVTTQVVTTVFIIYSIASGK